MKFPADNSPKNKALTPDQIDKLFEYGLENEFRLFDNVLTGENDSERNAVWQNFVTDPVSFFSNENLKEEAGYLPGQRLSHLAIVCKFLEVDSKLVKKYFELFPNDIYVLRSLGMTPAHPYATLAFLTETVAHAEGQYEYWEEGFLERKNAAPAFLLDYEYEKDSRSPFRYINMHDNLDFFYQCMNSGIADRVDPESINNFFLREDFTGLSHSEKINLLRYIIAYAHKNLLGKEVFHSVFTQANSTDQTIGLHNVAHSIIFSSRQPSSAYWMPPDYYLDEMKDPEENYSAQMFIFAALFELSELDLDEKMIEFICDFWCKNKNPIFAHWTLEVLSQNPGYSANILIDRLKHEENPNNRAAISMMLFRLELGELEITEQGVDIFEQWFDLGEFNSERYFAQTTTADGQVAVFDRENKDLQGFFSPDLTSQDSQTKKVSVGILKEMLFDKLKDERLGDEDKEGLIKIFQKEYTRVFLDYFRDYLGVDIFRFTAKEQMSVFLSLLNMNTQQEAELVQFVNKNKEYGFQALGNVPSLSYILFLNELEHSDIIIFNRIKLTIAQVREVNTKYASTLERKLDEIINSGKSLEEKRTKFKQFDSEIILNIALAKEKDFTNFDIEARGNSELSEAEQNFMIRCYSDNYDEGVERDQLISNLRSGFKNSNNSYYILYSTEVPKKPVGFMVIENKKQKNEDGLPIYYASGFNMLDIAQRQGIGEKFMEVVIKHFGNKGVVTADCDAQKMGPAYLRFGFIGTNIYREESTGKIVMDIAYSRKFRSSNFAYATSQVRNDDELTEPLVIAKDDSNFAQIVLNAFNKKPNRVIRKMGPGNSIVLEDRKLSFERKD